MRSYVMKVSRNGQVSIPAEARSRWGGAERMLVVDRGDYLLLRPASDDPVGELMGKHKGPGPTTDEIRKEERRADAARERRRR